MKIILKYFNLTKKSEKQQKILVLVKHDMCLF